MLYLYENNSGDPDFLFSGRIGRASSIDQCVFLAEEYWLQLPGGVQPGPLYIYDRGRFMRWTVNPGPPIALVPLALDPAYPPSGDVFPA